MESEAESLENDMYFPFDFEVDCSKSSKRDTCEHCRRPMRVCWCSFLPKEPVDIKTTVYILQHPFEKKRPLSTTPILQRCIKQGKCHIVSGKKFKQVSKPEIFKMLQSSNTILLYPSPDAIDITELPPTDEAYNLVVLDGTWAQAKAIYNQNEVLKSVKQVKLSGSAKSVYVVRTQPSDECLSTVESTAMALSYLEGKPDLNEVFIHPLRALCQFQLDHGAVEHQSKAWLIEKGLYKKQLKKKYYQDSKNVNGATDSESGSDIEQSHEELCDGTGATSDNSCDNRQSNSEDTNCDKNCLNVKSCKKECENEIG